MEFTKRNKSEEKHHIVVSTIKDSTTHSLVTIVRLGKTQRVEYQIPNDIGFASAMLKIDNIIGMDSDIFTLCSEIQQTI